MPPMTNYLVTVIACFIVYAAMYLRKEFPLDLMRVLRSPVKCTFSRGCNSWLCSKANLFLNMAIASFLIVITAPHALSESAEFVDLNPTKVLLYSCAMSYAFYKGSLRLMKKELG